MRMTTLAQPMLALTAAAALALAAPAVAQDAAAPAAPSAQPQLSPEDAAFQAKGQAFDARMTAMGGEINAAIQGAGNDAAKADADVMAVVARYQTDIDTFAADLEAFLDLKIAASTDETERAQIQQARANAPQAVRGIPQQVRTGVAQAFAARAAAPAAAPQQ